MNAFLDDAALEHGEGRARKKIGAGTAVILIVIAAAFDLLQWLVSMIPIIGFLLTPLVTFIAWLWFGIWFGLLGASVIRTSPLAYFGLLSLELVPLINLIPGTILMVAISIRKANRGTV